MVFVFPLKIYTRGSAPVSLVDHPPDRQETTVAELHVVLHEHVVLRSTGSRSQEVHKVARLLLNLLRSKKKQFFCLFLFFFLFFVMISTKMNETENQIKYACTVTG